MIKKLLLAIMIALPMSVFAQKFGTVNTADLMESLPEMKTVQEQMTAASNKYQDEFTKLQEEFNKKYQEFQGLEESTPDNQGAPYAGNAGARRQDPEVPRDR